MSGAYVLRISRVCSAHIRRSAIMGGLEMREGARAHGEDVRRGRGSNEAKETAMRHTEERIEEGGFHSRLLRVVSSSAGVTR